MATTETYIPRLKEQYENEIRPALKDELGLSSIMQVPRIEKITLNMGVGEAKTDAKQLDAAMDELTIIAGQRPQIRKARKSVAQFKIREGMPIGAKVTLRGARMYEFLDRLVSIALPAHPRLPRAQPALVRRPRQLLARRPRADHLSGDRLRRHPAGSRPRRDDHDQRRDRRTGARAAAGFRPAVRERRRPEEGLTPRGEDKSRRQAKAAPEVQGPRIHTLQSLWAAACRLPQVRRLPHLPAGARPPGRHPRHDEVKLVGEKTC